MIFTIEDYKKIEGYLQKKGVRDTDFLPATVPLGGGETIVIVQEGRNRNLTVKDFIYNTRDLIVEDFINVTNKYDTTCMPLKEVITLIPKSDRQIGQVITFLNENCKWVIYQFNSTDVDEWDDITKWENIKSSQSGRWVELDPSFISFDINDLSPKEIVIRTSSQDLSYTITIEE